MFSLDAMSESKHTRKGTVRQAAIERARLRRAERIRTARERENAVTEAVIDVATNRAAAAEAEHAAASSIARLRRMGENQQSIAELCEMTLGEVRAALTLVARRSGGSRVGEVPRAETTGDEAPFGTGA